MSSRRPSHHPEPFILVACEPVSPNIMHRHASGRAWTRPSLCAVHRSVRKALQVHSAHCTVHMLLTMSSTCLSTHLFTARLTGSPQLEICIDQTCPRRSSIGSVECTVRVQSSSPYCSSDQLIAKRPWVASQSQHRGSQVSPVWHSTLSACFNPCCDRLPFGARPPSPRQSEHGARVHEISCDSNPAIVESLASTGVSSPKSPPRSKA